MAQTNQTTAKPQALDLVFTKVTDAISITVKPLPVFEETSPEDRIFSFSYAITIQNLSEETVQLLSRHWIINSGGSFFDEVVGDGVVGMQPHIESGESFEYKSGAVIQDPCGSMKGTYTVRTASGKFIEVEIPEFELIHPDSLH